MSFQQRVVFIKDLISDSVFPWHTCLLCGKTTNTSSCLCGECSQKLTNCKRCSQCGCFFNEYALNKGSECCPNCKKEPKRYIDGFYSALPYIDAPRDYLLALKYRGKKSYAKPLAKCLAAYLKNQNVTADYIVAVPLHNNRLEERGYNQSELLAEIVSGLLNIKYLPKVLKRHKETKVQHKLNFEERMVNLSNAFSGGRQSEKIKGKRVLLIDDIMTSGSTMMNCALVLKELGAEEVYAASVASHLVR